MRGHIRSIDANLGPRNADSFRADLHPDLKTDFILANPFNMSDWGGENLRQDVRWKFGMPPVSNMTQAGWTSEFAPDSQYCLNNKKPIESI